jgi:ABC-type dipeptide/oligopeptide/nickel transport system permease subunit
MSKAAASAATALTEAMPSPMRRSGWRAALGVLLRDRTALVGFLFIASFVLVALLAPVLAPFSPTEQSIVNSLRPPNEVYWLGTDEFGRDILSRVLYGTRPALAVGILSVLVSMAIGIPLGMISGFRMGWTDRAVTAMVDIMLSFPPLLFALMIVTLLGAGLQIVVLAIGIAHVPIFVRLARSATMVVKNLDFISASRTFGATDLRILAREILPNILGPIIIMGTLSIAGAIREEAGLSFLGLGIQPPAPSWGNIIRDGIANILEAPWMAIAPGIFLTVGVFAFNMVGDSLRDMLDPRDLTAAARTAKAK